MKIRSFKIENYKSFRETDTIQLSDGFNIVVAPNNVGKTALLEVLSTRFPAKPHRTARISPSHPLNQRSRLEVEFVIGGEELKNILFRQNSFHWPIPDNFINNPDSTKKRIIEIFSSASISIICDIYENQNMKINSIKTSGHLYQYHFSDIGLL